ncbi:hypothetical protein [Puniceibacterium confluentis]|uniref:hypothetical protein n=1 Tax=Puniceibacterium confluentis TaxID=1958944 RepID=UPI003565A933
MSDPVTNMEIEDVLSSIRRLVSNDTRAKPGATVSGLPEKLVLTPAQRVVRDESATVTKDKAEDNAPMLLTRAKSDPVTEESGQDAEDTADDPEPVSVLDKALLGMVESELAEAMAVRGHARPQARKQDDSGSGEAADKAEAGVPVFMPRRTERRPASGLTLEQKIAELESMIAESSGSWQPADDFDADEDSDVASNQSDVPPADALTWEDHTPGTRDADERSDDTDVDVADQPADSERDAQHFAGNSMLEDALEHVDSFDFSRPPADAQEPEPEPEPEPVLESVPEPEPEQALELDDQTSVIDEDMLRDLVSDIVRQELQGALGERITRNVRKLVRREVQRALMAQSFE